MARPRLAKSYDKRTPPNENLEGYKVVTLCDFGTPGRRTIIGRHKNMTTASNQYARIWKIYHKLHGWKVWQEEIK